MMLGMAPDYDHLMVIQKVEVFEHALDSTSGASASPSALSSPCIFVTLLLLLHLLSVLLLLFYHLLSLLLSLFSSHVSLFLLLFFLF